MEQQFFNGTTTGTGAAITVSLGFTPSCVEAWNPTSATTLIWTSDMSDGYAKKIHPHATEVITSPRAAIGSTKSQVANSAFNYSIAGTVYQKAATAAGTAPTATTVPKNKYGLFGFEIGADGTIDKKDAAGNETGYASAALAIAALPTASSGHVLFMYVVVINTAADFVGATTLFDATGVTATYYNVANSGLITSGGITPVEEGDSTTYKGGFSIGTDSDLNVSGDTIYYRVWR